MLEFLEVCWDEQMNLRVKTYKIITAIVPDMDFRYKKLLKGKGLKSPVYKKN